VEGCTSSDKILITVKALPNADIIGNKPICVGESLTLEVLLVNNNQYKWSSGSNTNKAIVTPNQTTTYSVSITDNVGCTNLSSVQVVVNPLPIVNLGQDTIKTQIGKSATLDAGSGQTNYLWSNGSAAATIVVNEPSANYCVTVTNQFGCKASDCVYVKFINTGLDELNDWGIKLFPNPTMDVLNIQCSDLKRDLKVMIFGVNGQLVKEQKMTDLQLTIDVAHFSSGLYLIRFISNDGAKEGLFVKQ
jgi:hypothetical protein